VLNKRYLCELTSNDVMLYVWD